MNVQSPHSQFPAEDDCERLRELIPAYALGATDTDETAFVTAVLPNCPDERAELQAYLGAAEALLYSIPLAAPPAHLHDKLMDAIRADSRVAAGPAAPTHQVSPASLFTPLQAPPAPIPLPVLAIPQAQRASAPPRLWLLTAAAAIVLLAATNLYWFTQVEALRASQAQADTRGLVLASLLSSDVQRVALQGETTEAAANLYWTPGDQTAVLVSNRLPALAADRTYQLWLITGDTPISAGVFTVDPQGRATYVFTPSRALDSLDMLGISDEPLAGSSAPTTTPLLVGSV